MKSNSSLFKKKKKTVNKTRFIRREQGSPTFWYPWAIFEEIKLSRAPHEILILTIVFNQKTVNNVYTIMISALTNIIECLMSYVEVILHLKVINRQENNN